MSSWYNDADGNLKEEGEFKPFFRNCRNCGESTSPQKMGEDGWCDSCCGVKEIVSEEELQRRYDAAAAASLARAEKSPRYRKQKADAERLWQEHLKNKAQYEAIFGKPKPSLREDEA